ncbi:MAG TPA: hypothetical protein VNA87_07170, partial [Actinomycetota bacterium]|nr:hypothetical protein [Actinomycetota bacterium]
MTKRISIGAICAFFLSLLYFGGPLPSASGAYYMNSTLLTEGGGGGGGSSLSGQAAGQSDPGWLPFANVTTTLPAIQLDPLRPPTDTVGPLRIAVISSGVVPGVFPDNLKSRFVRQLGNLDDSLGYGTYASSAILQLHPTAQITSIGIYPGGRLNTTYLKDALIWASGWAHNLDAVLLAFPPSDFLDPMSLSLSPGKDSELIDA